MCEFCLKHGEGKKWYLQARNYSDDLLSDIRRRKFIETFFTDTESLGRDFQRIDRLEKAPRFIHINLGREERYCYGVSLSPDGGTFGEIIRGLDKSFLNGPQVVGMERLSKDEAISALRSHEQEGLCHSIWTFHAPFIGGVCNCDRSDCLAMRCTVTHGIPVMFRAEYVAAVDPDLCNGCRQCMRVCQFGAISYSASNKKAVIDQRQCYGCGICRSVCRNDAIRLGQRDKVPVAARLW